MSLFIFNGKVDEIALASLYVYEPSRLTGCSKSLILQYRKAIAIHIIRIPTDDDNAAFVFICFIAVLIEVNIGAYEK